MAKTKFTRPKSSNKNVAKSNAKKQRRAKAKKEDTFEHRAFSKIFGKE